MCTAATYKTKDFYMGRTLDYECSYGEDARVCGAQHIVLPFIPAEILLRNLAERTQPVAAVDHRIVQLKFSVHIPPCFPPRSAAARR